ncbi:MAG: zeta toxin family protein [Ferruginibacter sp.]
MPSLYIITGSNGAGKSTVGPDYLPLALQQKCDVFDGDKLFMKKQSELWSSGIRAHKEAKKLAFAFVEDTFDSLVEEALSSNADFVYEGHFTNDATWDIPKKFKANGYQVNIIFFGLANTDLSELRVLDRTKEGGHYVDPSTVASNFYGNLEKLNQFYILFNTVQIIDTSETEHRVLCVLENKEINSAIPSNSLPEWFQINLPSLLAKIQEKESPSL